MLWRTTVMPSRFVSSKISFAGSLPISSLVSIGIFSRSSFGDGVSWYSFNSFVWRTRVSISSLERLSLYSFNFFAVCSSIRAVRFFFGLAITTASYGSSRRYVLISPSKYPLSAPFFNAAKVSSYSKCIIGSPP